MEFFAWGITIGLALLLFGGKGKIKFSLADLQARCAAGDQSACALLQSMQGSGASGGSGGGGTGSCRCGSSTAVPVAQTNIPGSGAPGAYSPNAPASTGMRTFQPGAQYGGSGNPNADYGPFSQLGV